MEAVTSDLHGESTDLCEGCNPKRKLLSSPSTVSPTHDPHLLNQIADGISAGISDTNQPAPSRPGIIGPVRSQRHLVSAVVPRGM